MNVRLDLKAADSFVGVCFHNVFRLGSVTQAAAQIKSTPP
jgi:hypothetical protein